MAVLKNNDIAYALHYATMGKTGSDLDLAISNSAKFLSRHKLLGKRVNIIFNKLHDIQNKEKGVIEVKVKSKNKLGPTSLHEIQNFLKKYYKAEKIEIQEEIDDDVIGGVKIEVGEDIIDLTLQNTLNQLQKHLLRN